MTTRNSGIIVVAAALLSAACSDDAVTPPCPPGGQQISANVAYATSQAVPASPFDAHFAAAASEYGVDAGLLRGIAWVETRFHMVVPEGDGDHHNLDPAWGVMALRGARLERAAGLAGLDIASVRTDAAANIRAAAALLVAEARDAGVLDRRASEWAEALMRFSGIGLTEGRHAYADAVLQGTTGTALQQNAALAAAAPDCEPPAPPPPPPPPPSGVRTVWRPSPNYNDRMLGVGGTVSMIIVHTCEGGYIGCWSWLGNTVSGVSAHYVIDEGGLEISHLVAEEKRAWHIGATYDCSLNRSRRCELSGVQSNHFTVGIEHAGFASQSTFPEQQIDVSAQLACAITQRHAIPRDFQHLVAHGQLQPWNRTDPGPNWPWVRYLGLVQRHCNEVVVDDDVAWTDPAYGRASASAAWTATDATSGYYGVGYRWAATAPDATDALVFEVFVERPGSYAVDARWTAGTNRSADARFSIRSADRTLLAEAGVDQRTQHDSWRELASLTLPVGWHRVELSRAGAPGAVVVADAVRLRALP
jgi:hypothetical protein